MTARPVLRLTYDDDDDAVFGFSSMSRNDADRSSSSAAYICDRKWMIPAGRQQQQQLVSVTLWPVDPPTRAAGFVVLPGRKKGS